MQQTTSFKSESGAMHENALDAWLDDLNHWLKTSGVDNAPMRQQIVTVVHADLQNGNHLLTIVNGIKGSMPPAPPQQPHVVKTGGIDNLIIP